MTGKIFKSLGFVCLLAASPQLVANPDETSDPIPMPAVDCVINPYRVVDVSSPVAGVIENLLVDRSQRVNAGQVLARLEASVERANVELARYRAGVESEVELGRVNINFDRMRKQRIDSLLEENNVSRELADQVEREVQLSEWKLRQARELAKIRKLELLKAEAQLGQKSIAAPFDGFVQDIFKYPGEYVEDQAIARLVQLDPLVIEAIVPMENFGRIRPGMEADVVTDILLKESLRGEVIAVDRVGDTASNTFGVKLSMPNPDNRIPAGLKCVATFDETAPEQVASAEINTGTETALTPQSVESDSAEAADRESPGLLSSIIGDASAAMIPTSYMVMIETPASSTETKVLVNQLRDAGEQDFFVYRQQRRISLGVFKQRSAAERRQREIEGLGFAARTVARYQ